VYVRLNFNPTNPPQILSDELLHGGMAEPKGTKHNQMQKENLRKKGVG